MKTDSVAHITKHHRSKAYSLTLVLCALNMNTAEKQERNKKHKQEEKSFFHQFRNGCDFRFQESLAK